jgi:RNA polymerase sigma-70 factor (ECF subfamily)
VQPSPDTAELLQAVASGQTGAIDALLARDRPVLRELIARRLPPAILARVDPSDIVQEVHLHIAQRMEDYLSRRPMPYRAWVRRTALEAILRARRQHLEAECRSVEREAYMDPASSLHLAQMFLQEGVSPAAQAEQREQLRRVQDALPSLPETEQEILLLRLVENIPNQEIAAILEIDVATASRRFGRALLRLRGILSNGANEEGEEPG